MPRWPGRDGQRGPRVLTVAPFLFLRLVLVLSVTGSVGTATGRHPVQVFLQMAATATAAAGFERQIVALLRPQILMALALGPATSAAAGLQIREHGLLPGVEALAMHKLAHRAIIVVARHLHGVVQRVQTYQRVAPETLTGRCAAADRLAHQQVVVLHRVV